MRYCRFHILCTDLNKMKISLINHKYAFLIRNVSENKFVCGFYWTLLSFDRFYNYSTKVEFVRHLANIVFYTLCM